MFVIRRIEDGQFATRPGSMRAYTKRLQDARVFRRREAAEQECCGNERIIPLVDLLDIDRP